MRKFNLNFKVRDSQVVFLQLQKRSLRRINRSQQNNCNNQKYHWDHYSHSFTIYISVLRSRYTSPRHEPLYQTIVARHTHYVAAVVPYHLPSMLMARWRHSISEPYHEFGIKILTVYEWQTDLVPVDVDTRPWSLNNHYPVD